VGGDLAAREEQRASMETTTESKNNRNDKIVERANRVSASETNEARRGLIPAVLGFGVDVTEDAVTGAIGFADDVRRETRQAVVATIDFAESLSKAMLGIGRRTVERVDRLATDVLGGSEKVALGTIAGLRSISNNASALADQASRSIVGARHDGAASA
jgi:hypothetical protein